ncbi:tRNA preQ1(34) S-adenosylmethionine ribosyltransferase-isomerase QueA [Desulfolithobacter sp.]
MKPREKMLPQFRLSSYDYFLPPERIAQHPAARRDQSRLLVLHCPDGRTEHTRFEAIGNYLRPGDLLVVNNTKVFPARLLGHKESGGKVEMLLLHYPCFPDCDTSAQPAIIEAEALALVKSSRRPRPDSLLIFGDQLQARVLSLHDNGKVRVCLRFHLEAGQNPEGVLSSCGQIPLPPYIHRPRGATPEDIHRYQTRYARHTGSVAAPTAGLHFSDTLLEKILENGISMATVTLHVGYGTFAPVRSEDIREHEIHAEYVEVSADAAAAVNRTRDKGGRIWAVGTTSVRTLEFAAAASGRVEPVQGLCRLYIYPGFRFQVVDNLITNFHLPRSSLLFLVSALAGREQILEAYNEAVEKDYRFFSYGDAMAIITRAQH